MKHKNLIPLLEAKYKDDENSLKISKMSLELGEEWTTITMAKSSFDVKNRKLKRKYKKECAAYIKANLDTSQMSTGFLLSIFLPIIVKWIISWVSQKIIDNIFDD